MAVLLFRTDANVAMGTGHVMRCLALAQAWQDAGGDAVFAMAEATPSLEARLRIERIKVVRLQVVAGRLEDATQTANLALREQAAWVVVDGYQFDSGFQSTLQASGLKVLLIDDNGDAPPYSADLILNQNLHANENLYRDRATHTRLLLGPRYVLLRREFSFWRSRTLEIAPRARRILVTMGGSDPDNATREILRVLLAEPDLDLTVVVGGSNPHLPSIEQEVERAGRPVRLLKDVSDMPALMVWADLAVAGAGTTSWEMCMMGLPAALCVLARNQEKVARELSRLGAAVDLGYVGRLPARQTEVALRELIQSEGGRKKMSLRGREIVDGRGSERVACELRTHALGIRRATSADCKLLWDMANDPLVRASAFSTAAIPWDDHVAWFEAKMRTGTCHILIGEAQDSVVGQVRVEKRADGEGEIDVTVARDFRGAGVGSRLIDLAVGEVSRLGEVSRIHAYILPQNMASQRAFVRAGFKKVGEEQVKGQRAEHYVWGNSVKRVDNGGDLR